MKYKVMNRASFGEVTSIIVTDQPDNWKSAEFRDYWPTVAEFRVTKRHCEEEQRRRAYEYCAYMNQCIVVPPSISKVQNVEN